MNRERDKVLLTLRNENRPLINTYNSSTGTNRELRRLATSAMEDIFLSLFVCLSVCLLVSNFVQKRPKGIYTKFSGKVDNGPNIS